MAVALNLLYGVLGVTALYYGAEFLVKGGVSIARKLNISPLVIGLTLVAFATSAPELVVSVNAALSGTPDISLGNVVGSNICNIALILGLCAVISPLKVDRQLFRFDVPMMLLSSVLLVVFYLATDGVGRLPAAIFLGIFICYILWNIRQARRGGAESSEVVREAEATVESESKKAIHPLLAALLVILGLGLLVGGAKLFLIGSIFFARLMNVSDAVIGLTVVAVGTSLPELATSAVAAFKGESDIAIGNVVGSNIFNVLLILGIAPLITPLRNVTLSPLDMGVMLFCAVILLPFMRTGWKLSRPEGAFLLLIYFSYTAWLIAA
jgi:cation:H+ antiporter